MPNKVTTSLRQRGLLPRPRLIKKLTRLAESLPTQGNHLRVFFNGDLLYKQMLQDIASAQQRISLEMYMFLDDPIGQLFSAALVERAQAGVTVRVLYDAVGCFGVANSFFLQMRQAGIQVEEYHPIAPWRRRYAWFRRNHRKSLIIDGLVGFTGGVNIGLPWASLKQGGDNWRDTHARVQGPAAGDLEVLFTESWVKQTGELISFAHQREPQKESLHTQEIDGSQTLTQIYVIGGRGLQQRRIRKLHMFALGRARKQVSITSPYLVPDRQFRRALHRAAQRGVKVRLLVPDRSDIRIVDHACRAFFSGYLRRGIEIYLWQPSILHAKTGTVDHRFSTIGTSNLDNLSFYRNLESNLVIDEPIIVDLLNHQFEQDLLQSVQIDAKEWAKRSCFDRAMQWLGRLLSPLL